MPIEYSQLEGRPVPFEECPFCDVMPFEPFLRGIVQSWWRKLLGKPYCALICENCKEIVGHEKP